MKLLILTVLSFLSISASGYYQYPETPERPMMEVRFDEWIVDEYKWMENASDPMLWSWVDSQKAFTKEMISQEWYGYFHEKLEKLAPKKEQEQQTGGKIFFAAIEKGNSYFPQDDFNKAKPESEKYKVEAESVHGGDLARVRIIKKADNSVVDILVTKFFQLVKWEDSETFLYTSDRDERLGGGSYALFRHKVGKGQGDDEQIYQAELSSSSFDFFFIGDRAILMEQNGYLGEGFIGDFDMEARRIIGKVDLKENTLGGLVLDGQSYMLLKSFEDANNGKVLLMDITSFSKELMIPEQDFVIEEVSHLENGRFIVIGHQHAESVVALFNKASGQLEKLELGTGYRFTFGGYQKDIKAVRLTAQSYDRPPVYLAMNIDTREVSITGQTSYDIEVEASRVFYTASNGRPAPLWVIKKKGVELTKETPMLLYGYGGFGITLLPTFNPSDVLPWLDKGGAYATASLPGSYTYGKSWNDMAKVGNRINSWDSFANAGKKLIELGWTSSDHLGCFGSSNGGLLVSGTIERHPEVFKAASPQVGVNDLLNFSLFTAGKYWMWEYGNPFVEKDFRELLEISPYHNLKEKEYPATLVMTAEFDDRVVPMHSFKYLAKLQKVQAAREPALLYMKEWGGHGRRSGTKEAGLRYMATMYAFFAEKLGL